MSAELAKQVREALKAAGYGRDAVSVVSRPCGHSQAVNVRIKNLDVSKKAVEKLVAGFRLQRYDDGPSGEPLLGANRYVDVSYDWQIAGPVERELAERIAKLHETNDRTFEYRGQRLFPVYDGDRPAGWMVDGRFIPGYYGAQTVAAALLAGWE